MCKNQFTGLLCAILCITFPELSSSQTNYSGAFTFKLSNTLRTSAGVYKKDSTLIKTLWANKIYPPGTYTEYWDGTDDHGNIIALPDANYDIKILSNNVKYTWEGNIGNTSSAQTGSPVHKGYYTSMTGMAITGTTAYFCQGYSENYSSIAKFDLSNPQVRLDIFPGRISTLNTDFVATDGINVYWAGYNAYKPSNSFVHATKVSDDSKVSFGANGSAYTVTKLANAKTYISAIDTSLTPRSKPSGLAVQQSGNYLFVAHGGLGQIHVLNKTTGALVQNLLYNNPRNLATDGNSLWMVTGLNTLAKYHVNGNGTLSSPTVFVSGVATPGALAVSGVSLAVIDEGMNQVVRFFNNTTGAAYGILGTSGGYAATPDVTNTKFMFNDFRGNTFSFLAYAPDGGFWMGDPGNFRELHFTAKNEYVETIMSLGTPYSTCVDPNNIDRIFANYLEFAVDYSQPLSGSTGWTLVKNWGYNRDQFSNPHSTKKLLNVITLSNGHTYGYDYNTGAGLVELSPTGLRITGASIGNGIMNADGSLTKFSGSYNVGSNVTYTKYPLKGFDAYNNPVWSAQGILLATTPVNTVQHPNNFPGNVSPVSYNFVTTTDKVIFYNPSKYVGGTSTLWNGYHLGAIKKGGNKWLWETQKSDDINYAGAFPEADYFEIGNGVNQNAGSNVNVVDNNIITGYHGEFWKNSQTNYFNHYLDDGLAVGQFGTDGYISPRTSSAMKAGNVLSPILVKAITGDLYLYHGDESNHGGVHRWKVSNLSSISEQYISIAYPSVSNRIALGYLNLHAGLPFASPLPNSAGWNKTGVITSSTSLKKYVDDGSPDVFTVFSQSTGTAFVSRDLGSNNVTQSWKISGQLSFENSDFVVGSHITSYADVLDASGKILTRFYYVGNSQTKVISIYFNNVIIASSTSLISILSKYQPFKIELVNGQASVTYANLPTVTTTIFDPTASWTTPKTLRQYFVTAGTPAYNKNIGFMDMRFYENYSQAINIPPVADAGLDQSIKLPLNNVTLLGTGIDADGNIINYLWTKISGPSSGAVTNSTNATTTVTGLTQGVYKFELKVTDNADATDVDTVQITVNAAVNIPPVADAGSDQVITLPSNSVILTGVGTDTDGTITNYLWTKISGPSSGAITNSANATTTVTGLIQGVYKFELKVTDNADATSVDTVQITVNAAVNIPPVADAGSDQVITLPSNSVILTSVGTDTDGTITNYLWTKISGPSSGAITNSANATTTVTGLIQGVYKFELKVTDNADATSVDTVQITVNAAVNIPPVADAGSDQVITLPSNSVILTGVGTDTDGTITNYLWTKISGPLSGTITNSNIATTTISGLTQGVYKFELKVTDNSGTSGLDTVQVSVNAALNIPPVADAGSDQMITLPPNSVTLTGVGTDTDGTITNYLWTKISGPSSAAITNAANATTTVTSLTQGVYRFELKVTDNMGATGIDIVQITVNPAPNNPPIADAGSDQVITLPSNSVTLTSVGTDTDSTITNYLWTKISGPLSGTITNSNIATTTISGLTQGVYKFELKVTDNSGTSGLDTVQVSVNAALNIPPVADAGSDQMITLPPNSVTLTGVGTDTDGTITKYSWTKISGPSSGIIINSTKATSNVIGLKQGAYKFELTVTDNAGATGVDTVQITVNPPPNIPPVANAGLDQVITLPVNTVSLAGSGGDADGNIVSYYWAKIFGPSSYTFVNPSSPVTDVFRLVTGIYILELTVMDNSGAIAKDTVQITVNPVPNIAPTADAGPDQMILLPGNRAALSASGSDPDGTVAGYLWTKIAGPPSGVIANRYMAGTFVSNLTRGDYQFELQVTDNNGMTGRDTMQLTVVASSLPLKLLSFTGKLRNDAINLFWETTNEKNVLGFEIERMNANTWNRIGFIPATNGGLVSNKYAFTDSSPVIGSNYYRLKIIDIDGKFVYSYIISFEVNSRKNLIYQNFPNPFSKFTTIKFEIAQRNSVKIVVFSSTGKRVATLLNEIKQPGVYRVRWDAANIAQGNYFYKVVVGNITVAKKMLKAR